MARQSKIQFYMSLGRGRSGDGSQAPAYICLIILVSLLVCLLTYVVWDQTIPEQPTFSIEQFYVPALDKTAASTDHHGTLNTTITFDLQIKNPDDAVNYDAFDVTLYYGHNFSTSIGSISMPGFRQGRKKTAHRIETFNISDGVPWEIAMEEVLTGFAPFSVGLSTAVKYTKFSRYSGRAELNLGADVNVNYYGIMAGTNGIKLLRSNSVHKSLRQGPNEESKVGLADV